MYLETARVSISPAVADLSSLRSSFIFVIDIGRYPNLQINISQYVYNTTRYIRVKTTAERLESPPSGEFTFIVIVFVLISMNGSDT
jgi:hypothetical protein